MSKKAGDIKYDEDMDESETESDSDELDESESDESSDDDSVESESSDDESDESESSDDELDEDEDEDEDEELDEDEDEELDDDDSDDSDEESESMAGGGKQKGGVNPPLISKPKIQIPTNSSVPINSDSDEDEDDDNDGSNYLQKLDKTVNENYILNFHPESACHNNQEIACMTRVVRNKDGIIIDALHRTIPYLTKYEKARVLGQRAKQIESGAPSYIQNLSKDIIDGYIIAEMELKEKKIPFIIRRPLPNGGSEYWKLKDLEDIFF